MMADRQTINILHYPRVEQRSARKGINEIHKKEKFTTNLVAKKPKKVSMGDQLKPFFTGLLMQLLLLHRCEDLFLLSYHFT